MNRQRKGLFWYILGLLFAIIGFNIQANIYFSAVVFFAGIIMQGYGFLRFLY